MYQLDDKPKERNFDFLTGYHEKLRQLFNIENIWDSQRSRSDAEDFIYTYKDKMPDKNDAKEDYFYCLGRLWGCHDYLEGEDE